MEQQTDYRALYEAANDLLHVERQQVKELNSMLADAQATIAALQARVQELEESRDAWKASQECSEKAYMALVNQIPAERFDYDPINVALLDGAKEQEIIGRKQIADLQSQLTQRTAELEAVTRERDEAAKDRDDWITSWRALQRYNERIEAELERVRAERDHAKKMEAIQKEVADNQTWHVQKLRTLIAALPKVEGEINERFCTGSYYSSPRDYRTHVTFEAALVALLKHRQGMEG